MDSTGCRESYFVDAKRWAEQQFGGCQWGDARRTRRLVDYAARPAADPGGSTHAVCAGDDAVAEGTYRWLRNDAIDPKAVDEGPFQATAAACRNRELVLAIQDTTTLVFSHSVADELGKVGGAKDHQVSGVLAHSTLMIDAYSGEPPGLSDQQRWSRPLAPAGRQKKTSEHKKRAYQDKESVKWEQSTEAEQSHLIGEQDFEEEPVIPSGLLASDLDLEHVHGEVTKDREVLGGVSSANPALVLAEGEIKNPVKTILDAPVCTHVG